MEVAPMHIRDQFAVQKWPAHGDTSLRREHVAAKSRLPRRLHRKPLAVQPPTSCRTLEQLVQEVTPDQARGAWTRIGRSLVPLLPVFAESHAAHRSRREVAAPWHGVAQ